MTRTIIVGDVHGCAAELDALLDRVHFALGDKLVLVGDLVARGPDSLGVLDIARRTGAIIVRGNHEQRLLDWRDDPATPLSRTHLDVAHAMRDVDWTLFDTAPLWVDMPEHGLRVVHAGVVPGVPIEEQHPRDLLHLRALQVRGVAGGQEGVLWGKLYAGPVHVLFGHNALPGLQLHPYATGLDTGCVYGGSLTALVLPEGEKVPRSLAARRALLVSQPAARIYFETAKKRRVA